MIRQSNLIIAKWLLIGILFIFYFLYFGIFNRYHIIFFEQNQLFLYTLDYLKGNFSLPGGLTTYTGSFFTQFFISSWAGALIFTLNALTVFIFSFYIYKKHNFENILLALVPVWFLSILQSSELFTFDQSIGFLLLISFCALYISINKSVLRYIFYFTGWPVLYLLAGGFSLPVVLFCALHELLFRKQKNYHIISVLFIITGALLPFIFSRLIFYIAADRVYTYPLSLNMRSIYLYSLILLLFWNPLLLLAVFFLKKIKYFKYRLLSWNLINLFAGIFIVVFMVFVVYKYAYNKRTELMLGIDHHIQQAEWSEVLKLADLYPDLNSLVIYYTNLALYKSGLLSDRMFSYPQIGSNGLRLRWERNSNLFFGGEIFYYLSYTNEANRWAFEAMIAKGLNPRSLKRLVITNITNGNSAIAKKYIHKLNQTLFYRKCAQYYDNCLSDTALASNDSEISRNRDFLVHSDFISNAYTLNLEDLLINHPENKMAYEYYMASLLLDKRLDEFAQDILKLKDYGYSRIPVHFEEALIFYNSYENKNIMPEGFSFRPGTIQRFQDYARTYSEYRSNLTVAANQLKKRYGKTYWFYLQFINN